MNDRRARSAGYRKALTHLAFKPPKEKLREKQSLFGLIAKNSNKVPGPWTYTIDDGIAKEAGAVDRIGLSKNIQQMYYEWKGVSSNKRIFSTGGKLGNPKKSQKEKLKDQEARKNTYLDIIIRQGEKEKLPGPGEYFLDKELIDKLPQSIKKFHRGVSSSSKNRTGNLPQSPKRSFIDEAILNQTSNIGPNFYLPGSL